MFVPIDGAHARDNAHPHSLIVALQLNFERCVSDAI